MGIPVLVAWMATAVFCLLLYRGMSRLARLDYQRLGSGVRQGDLAGLLMAAGMAAMVSPVGAPVPVAGWQTLFAVTACWFAVVAVRNLPDRNGCRHCDLHHAIGAGAMVYMLAAMPHGGAGHSVSPTMVAAEGTSWALPGIAAVGAGYFAADAVLAVRRGLRARRVGTRPPEGVSSRFGCRAVMSLGMAGMFAAGLMP